MEQNETGEAQEPKKRWPMWAKVLLGIGCLILLPFLIVVVGLVATLVVPNVMKKIHVANQTKAKADIAAICNALDSYAIENEGRYPSSLVPLVTPDEHGFTFLKAVDVPRDPWGRMYVYTPPTSGARDFDLYTLGSDGVPGGSGDAQDIDLRSILDGKL